MSLAPLRLVLTGLAMATGAAPSLGAAASWPPALVHALLSGPDAAPETCAQSTHAASSAAYVRTNFTLRTVRLRSGPELAVVEGGGSCVCGDNCKLEIFAHRGSAYVSVLSDYTIDADVRPDGTVVTTAHDSAAVVDRTTYRWNGTRYADVADEVVLYGRNVAKPALRRIRFAPGTSSATVTGTKLAAGFDDRYQFDGAAKQTVTVTVVKRDAHFDSVAVTGLDGMSVGSAKRGSVSVKLPASGAYGLVVSGADDQLSSYTLTIAIR